MFILTIVLALLWIIIASSRFKIPPFISLILAGLFVGISNNLGIEKTTKLLSEGFGGLMSKIALIVILGCLLGVFLEKSGATTQIARSILNFFGEKRPILAITIIGAVVGIPIFCDSGYVLLSGLTRPLANQSKKSLAGISLGLAGGLYTTHTLLPPHPGPVAAMGSLGLNDNMAILMLIGFIIVIPTTLIAYFVASVLGKKVDLKPLENGLNSNYVNTPSTIASFVPIVVPIVLLFLGSFLNEPVFKFIGNPLIALLIGLVLAISLVKSSERKNIQEWFRTGIIEAGPILILVGAGGAFGAIIKETPLKDFITDMMLQSNSSKIWFLTIVFLISAFFKTTQGSTTAAMTIVSAMLAPLLAVLGFQTPTELALLLCSIAGGAMMVSHANDAYFWVISYYSGFSLKQGYQTITPLTFFQGITVFIFTILIYLFVQ
jgi:gluconate:H+ symporter, GntP family